MQNKKLIHTFFISSKLNFLLHFKSKTKSVTSKKCNSHLQYYNIDLNFSIKLQEINLNVCEEYKTEREARRSNCTPYTEKKDLIESKKIICLNDFL